MKLFGFEITRRDEPKSGALRNALQQRDRQPASLRTPPDWLLETLGATGTSASGEHVTEESSMSIAAVYAAVRVLSEDVAALPFKLYRRRDDGAREEARDHPLYRVLHREGNDIMTAMQLREVMMVHLCLWGNAYAEIEVNGSGDVTGLWPISPRRVDVETSDRGRDMRYRVTLPSGEQRTFRKEQILHVPGLGFDGVRGKSPVRLMREGLGISKAAEKYGASFFGNDATPGLALQHPGKLSDEAFSHLRSSWNAKHQGAGNAHRLAILEEGMAATQIGIPPEDAQFLETRKFQVTEVARMFRLPPHMLADLERATFSNIESQSIEYVTRSLRPWLVRWEQAVNRRLLLPSERDEYYSEHVVDALLRGDIQSRYDAYTKGRNWGWLSANDIRRKENMNPVEGGDGYLQPLNMVPAGDAPPQGERTAERPEEVRSEERALPRRYQLAQSFEPILRDVIGRASRREIAEVRDAVQRYLAVGDREGFKQWLREFETEHAEWMVPRLLPAYQVISRQMAQAAEEEIGEGVEEGEMETFTRDYTQAYAARHAGSSAGQLRNVTDEAMEPAKAVKERLREWEGEEDNPARVDKQVRREQARAMNAFSKAAWATLGVAAHIWRTTGQETCPYCDSLAGKRVQLSEWFVANGESIRDMDIYGNVGHPPLHDGCDCYTAPSLGGRSAPSETEIRTSHAQIIAELR